MSHLRKRSEKRWKTSFHYSPSIEDFLESPRSGGGYSIRVGTGLVDFLVQDRAANTTLVVFSGALSLNAKFTPAFSGLKLAEDTGVNLISVSDPSMALGEITAAWYLGSKGTGPLRPHLSRMIHHILDSLSTRHTILFGGSGGGYAASHLAFDFPGSTAFIFNPRLTLSGKSNRAVRRYFDVCHGLPNMSSITEDSRRVLEPYGPVSISDLFSAPLNHDLVIYQNLLDSTFMQNQLLKFLGQIPWDPRVRLKLSIDELGHVPIPGENVRRIIRALSQDCSNPERFENAGFLPIRDAMSQAFKLYPSVVEAVRHTAENHLRKLETVQSDNQELAATLQAAQEAERRSRNRQIRFRKKSESLEEQLGKKDEIIAQLRDTVNSLKE